MKPRVLLTTPLIALIRIYQRTLPALYFWPRCRFEPSCSNYCIQALEQRKFLIALALSAWRILRCNPWCGGQGYDPVPERGWRRRNPEPRA